MGNSITIEKLKKYEALLYSSDILVYEYHPDTDTAIKFDNRLDETARIENYMSVIEDSDLIKQSEREHYVQFLRGMSDGCIELEYDQADKQTMLNRIRKIHMTDEVTGEEYLLISKKDITKQRKLEMKYREQAQCDPLTKLYNRTRAKEAVEHYLNNKTPYESCGMLVIDLDYFKGVNDSYGHLFGDKVLIAIADLLMNRFEDSGIVSRVGGDEFTVFIRNINNKSLISEINGFIKSVRTLTFEENDYTPTVSIGVCFIPENAPHYSYDQIFSNADWALYQAKKQGRNRYIFCDNLHRFEEKLVNKNDIPTDIDARYFQNDILATAFEVFETSADFMGALSMMLQIIGLRFQLDRISVIHGDLEQNVATCIHQWRKNGIDEVVNGSISFSKEDFLDYYRCYDDYNTLVLNYDQMGDYSQSARNVLIQGGAKTVLFVAMYIEGRYDGVVAFVTCEQKRFWSMDKRRELSEVVKLFSVYIKRSKEINQKSCGCMSTNEYDDLTGLISFSGFKDKVERVIVRKKPNVNYIMVYSDIQNFTDYNREYGYENGDRLLKEFANYIIGTMQNQTETFFSRIVSDQFILFMPYDISIRDMDYKVKRLNDTFIRSRLGDENKCNIRIRTGMYRITDNCNHASTAIDAANFARKQIKDTDEMNVVIYEDFRA